MGYDEFDGFDYDEAPREPQGPKGLRDAYDALKAKYGELQTAHATLNGKFNQRNLKDVLADKGLRPGLARVIAKEDVDLTDPAAIEAWLSDTANQEDFGFSISAGDPAGSEGSDGAEGGPSQADYAAELAKIQGASNGAMPASDASVTQAQDQIHGAKSVDEINAVLAAAKKNFS